MNVYGELLILRNTYVIWWRNQSVVPGNMEHHEMVCAGPMHLYQKYFGFIIVTTCMNVTTCITKMK
jgi:hypothetical protein